MSRGSGSSATNDPKAPAATARAPCCAPRSLTAFTPCGAYCGGRRPRACPFRSHPTAAAQHLTPPQPRGSRSPSAHRVPRTRSSRPRGARRRAPTARSHLIYESCSAVWLRWRAPRAGRRPVSERARETGGAAAFRRPLRSRLGRSEAAVRYGAGLEGAAVIPVSDANGSQGDAVSRWGDARRRKDRKERTE